MGADGAEPGLHRDDRGEHAVADPQADAVKPGPAAECAGDDQDRIADDEGRHGEVQREDEVGENLPGHRPVPRPPVRASPT